MAEDIGGALQFLGGLLALPQTLAQQKQQSQLGQQIGQYTQAGKDIPPQLLYQLMAPPQAQPYLGGLGKGMSTVGSVLATLGGGSVAPRPPTEYLQAIGAIGRYQADLRKRQAGETVAESMHDPGAQALARAGAFGPAVKLEHPGGGHGEFAAWQAEHPGASVEEWMQFKASMRPPPAGTLFERDPAAWERQQRLATQIAGERTTITTQAREDVKRQALTATTKSMVEAAPKVRHLVERVERDLDRLQTGPYASRYQEFMAGKIGAPNPEWTHYRTNVGLLTTLVMRMHAGARGAEGMREHFRDLLNGGIQSAPNMREALRALREYADDVEATGVRAPSMGGSPDTGTPPAGDPEINRMRESIGLPPLP